MKTKHTKPTPHTTISTPEAASLAGLSSRQLRNLATKGLFPVPEHGLYDLPALCKGLITHYREQLARHSSAEKKRRLEYWGAKSACETFALERDRSEHVSKAAVAATLELISRHQRSVLQRKLETELPPRLVGLDVIAIQEACRALTDEICRILQDRTQPYQ